MESVGNVIWHITKEEKTCNYERVVEGINEELNGKVQYNSIEHNFNNMQKYKKKKKENVHHRKRDTEDTG